MITTIEYFKHLVQSNFRELLLSKKLRKNTSDLRDKKLEIESFIDISELLSGTSESEILFQNLLEYLVFTMNATKGVILSKEPNSGIYELKATLGIKDDLNKKIFRENKGVLSILKKEKKSLILNFSEDLPLLSFSEKNSMVGPFLNGKNLNGCIILYDKESRKGFVDFDQYDLRFFNSIVKKISLSYNNIILLDNVKKSKKLIDNIMSSISTGIVKINLMGEIEYINDSAIEIFQLDKSVLLDNHYAIVFEGNPELFQEALEDLMEMITEGEHYDYAMNELRGILFNQLHKEFAAEFSKRRDEYTDREWKEDVITPSMKNLLIELGKMANIFVKVMKENPMQIPETGFYRTSAEPEPVWRLPFADDHHRSRPVPPGRPPQRAHHPGRGRPRRPDRGGGVLLSNRGPGREARGDGGQPLPRAHDVQGHRDPHRRGREPRL